MSYHAQARLHDLQNIFFIMEDHISRILVAFVHDFAQLKLTNSLLTSEQSSHLHCISTPFDENYHPQAYINI